MKSIIILLLAIGLVASSCNIVNKHRTVSKTTTDSASAVAKDSATVKKTDSIATATKVTDLKTVVKKLTDYGIALQFDTNATANTGKPTIITIGGATIETNQPLIGAKFNNLQEDESESALQTNETSATNLHYYDSGGVKAASNTKVVKTEKVVDVAKQSVRIPWLAILVAGLLVAGYFVYRKYY